MFQILQKKLKMSSLLTKYFFTRWVVCHKNPQKEEHWSKIKTCFNDNVTTW